jgi:hypothetical protein
MSEKTALIFTAIDPISKRQRKKSYSLIRYDKTQAEALGKAWRDEVLAGKHPFVPAKKKGLIGETGEDDEETQYNPATLFKSESIDDLDVPDDKFGMSFLL